MEIKTHGIFFGKFSGPFYLNHTYYAFPAALFVKSETACSAVQTSVLQLLFTVTIFHIFSLLPCLKGRDVRLYDCAVHSSVRR